MRFKPYLYLRPQHLQTQTPLSVSHFLLFKHTQTTASAIFQCAVLPDGTALSPPRAPFGGIQCDDSCDYNDISQMLQCIEDWARSSGLVRIVVQLPAACYNFTTNDLLLKCYTSKNYQKIIKNLNHHVVVSSSVYEKTISSAEKRRLKKCWSAGFECELWKEPDIGIIYDFLNFCRSQKGYHLSMSLHQLGALITTFPDEIMVFTVKDDQKIISLSVTVKVSRSAMYCFLSASLPSYSAYSPSVLLIYTLYNFCQKADISVLDLGTSLDHHGAEKAGLIQFKENMGGLRSSKVTFLKNLSTDLKIWS